MCSADDLCQLGLFLFKESHLYFDHWCVGSQWILLFLNYEVFKYVKIKRRDLSVLQLQYEREGQAWETTHHKITQTVHSSSLLCFSMVKSLDFHCRKWKCSVVIWNSYLFPQTMTPLYGHLYVVRCFFGGLLFCTSFLTYQRHLEVPGNAAGILMRSGGEWRSWRGVKRMLGRPQNLSAIKT